MIQYVSQLSWYDILYDMLRTIITASPHVLLVGSEVCTADKPSRKHACICCVHHLEYNAKYCSAWFFLFRLFGKSSCIRTTKWEEGEREPIEDSAFPCLLMHMQMYRKYHNSLFNTRYLYHGKKHRDAPVHRCFVAGLVSCDDYCLPMGISNLVYMDLVHAPVILLCLVSYVYCLETWLHY